MTALRTTALPALLLCLTTVACDDRTPEEKGRDYADEKLGFVEGAADELSNRGKKIGSGIGKGVGELVKGTGSAVKDVTNPPVEVKLNDDAQTAGLKVGQANEGSDTGDSREVVVHLTTSKNVDVGARLAAYQGGKQVSHSSVEKLSVSPGDTQILRFKFDASVRLSKIESFHLSLDSGKKLAAEPAIEAAGITLSQLSEETTNEHHQVALYAVFKSPFTQGLSLRAYDAEGQELGRSAGQPALKQGADTATFITFTFDKRTPLARVASYKLYADTAAKAEK